MRFRDKQQTTICVIAAAIVCVFVLFWYLPLRSKIKAAKRAKSERSIAIAKGTADAGQLPLLQEQLSKVDARLGDYEANIPGQREHGVFLQRIAELMKECVIDNKAVKEEVARFRAQFQTVNYCYDASVREKIPAEVN